MTSLKTSIKTITYLSDIGCLEIQGASLGSQWDTTKTSLIDTLSFNSGSTVNVADSTLISDSISLTGLSALNINEDGHVATDSLTVDNSTVTISDEVSAGWAVGDAALYANNIKDWYVEVEQYTQNDPVASVQQSYDYLNKADYVK